MRKQLFFILAMITCTIASQVQAQIKWENPLQQSFPVERGRAWNNELKSTYNRLPLRAKEKVRPPLWDLSQQSAGLSIAFYSNAPEITVRYVVGGGLAMFHMPTTGVSGMDLYATDVDGRQRWCAGRFAFKDTVTCRYTGLSYDNAYHRKGYEFELFLPLYNSVSWLEIGVPQDAYFSFLPVSEEKPLVIYGTSIAQGACASRPGMAWTNIVKRKLECPVINLGFSGNGKLESELFDLLAETDAKMYIIDCMPNLPGAEESKLIYDRCLQGVRKLRKASSAPILLVEHSGYTNELTSKTTEDSYRIANVELRKAYEALQKEGIVELHYLTKEEIGLSMDAMVEGVHPNDLGMQQYADSYVRKIKEVLHQESDDLTTSTPCKQRRDANTYEWNDRHEQVLKLNKEKAPEILMIGNSITNYWAGEPLAPHQWGKASWEKLFKGKVVRNLGFGWDRVENVLWRIHHGELDGYRAKCIAMMIGTNNLDWNTDEEIIAGIRQVVKAIRQRQPDAKLYVIGILPRKDMEERVRTFNLSLEKELQHSTDALYLNLGEELMDKEGRANLSLFRDGLHPNEKGYELIAKELGKVF